MGSTGEGERREDLEYKRKMGNSLRLLIGSKRCRKNMTVSPRVETRKRSMGERTVHQSLGNRSPSGSSDPLEKLQDTRLESFSVFVNGP